MGNCIRRCLSNDPNHPSSPTSNDYTAAKSHFSETVAGGDDLKLFTFEELKTATGNFKEENLLGEGSIRRVFKGWIDERTFAPSDPGSGTVVAIKRFRPRNMECQSELRLLGRLSHPNLIKLLGYCLEDEGLFLVYEFASKGSLADNLFIKKHPIEPLSWNLRLKIAIGVARGIAFLHRSQIIYGSVKPSNILLDGNYNAKVSNFGFGREGPPEGYRFATSRVTGTPGHLAPEYYPTGSLHVKSEVYGFGVMLLEMMTGLRAIDTRRPDGQKNLGDWLKRILTDKKMLKDIMDARMKGQYSFKAILRAAQITSRCLERDFRSRPSMDEVLQVLEHIESMKVTPQ